MNAITHAQTPQALFFGSDEKRLFGCLHPGTNAAPAPFGLVVCNPFGFESLHAHRSLRAFATASAAAGIPTLRFDYFGCGNSSGDEYAPDLLQAWVQSIHAAVDELKRRTGVSRVCLLGLRLGSLLATLAAQEREDIAGLVAIAPVVQGRQYIREMRALFATGDMHAVTGNNGETLVEAGGFFFTDSAAQTLSAIDLRTPEKLPARRILVLQRDDMPASPRWPDALRALGAEVSDEAWPGYAAMMEDPQKTRVPESMVHNTVLKLQAWGVEDAALAVAGRTVAQVTQQDSQYQTADFQETVMQVPAGGAQLFGILTTPSTGTPKTGVLLLNQGCVHHIGPSRLWVTQARHWASQGLAVLRVDLSGLGETEPQQGLAANQAYSPVALDEIASALHYLQALCADGCHLLGVCSGAYHAFQSAVAGKPLLSAVVINPWIFSVSEAQSLNNVVAIKDYELEAVSQNFKRKLLSLEPWKKLLSGKMDYRYVWTFLVKRVKQRAVPVLQKLGAKVGFHPSTPLSRELGQAVRHGTRLRLVFAEGDEGLDVLRQNAQHTMDSLQTQQKLSLDFVSQADHTFTAFSAREKLRTILNQRISV